MRSRGREEEEKGGVVPELLDTAQVGLDHRKAVVMVTPGEVL